MALDTTSKGDFMSNKLEEATELVQNLAANNANHCPNYDKRSKGTPNTKAIEELNAKMDLILKVQQRSMNMCDETSESGIQSELHKSSKSIQQKQQC